MRISDWSSDVCSSDLLRKKASRVMAPDRCDSAGESGNCRGQDHRLSKIQQTLADRSGKPCRIHDRHLRNEPAAAHCGHPLVPDRPSWLWNERTCCHECQRDKPVSRRGAKILREHRPDRRANKMNSCKREGRSADRRVGKEGVSTCRSRWSLQYKKKNRDNT